MSARTTSFIGIKIIVARPYRNVYTVANKQILRVRHILLAKSLLDLLGLCFARKALGKNILEVFGRGYSDLYSLVDGRVLATKNLGYVLRRVSSQRFANHQKTIAVAPARASGLVTLAFFCHFLH